jgi:peptide/nickel transport system substrate-binding protein/oligopeptide transport system substrate-binding protein
LLLLAGCTAADEPARDPTGVAPAPEPERDDPDTRAGGTLRVALDADPVSIDPRFVVDDEGELLVDALFDPLVRLNDRGEPIPAAARRWDIGGDGRIFTFHLRDARFHDGTPVTAEDFARTFNRIADGTAEPVSYLAYLLADVRGIEAAQEGVGDLAGVEVLDAETLRITLAEPQPAFIRTLADPSLVPTPPAADVDPEGYGEEPIGNGAFAMAGPRERGEFIRLSRAEDHRRPALLDEVLFTVYDAEGDEQTTWDDLLDGQLHVAGIGPERRAEATQRFGRSSDGYSGPGLLDGIRSTVYLYGFDTSRPPFDDARLRRAISLAIDREALADEATQDRRVPATSLVPPAIPGTQRTICGACQQDLQEAERLLDEVLHGLAVAAQEPEAPEDDGGEATEGEAAEDEAEEAPEEVEPLTPAEAFGTLTLTYNRGSFHSAIAEQMAEDLEEVLGLEVGFQGRDLAPFVQGIRSGEVPFFRLGWDVTEPTAAAYLYPLFHSSQIGLDNLTRFADDEVDDLLELARRSPDEAERQRALRGAERRILEQMPAIPLLWYRHDVVVRPEVQDLVYSPLGRINLPEVWLDEETDPS